MLLVMDVGNTNTVLGLFDEETLVQDWRIRTEVGATVDEFGMLVRNLFAACDLQMVQVKDIAISCVVPPMLNTLLEVSVAKSNGEAKRVIQQNGARVNDVAISDIAARVRTSDLSATGTAKLSSGRKNHALVQAV